MHPVKDEDLTIVNRSNGQHSAYVFDPETKVWLAATAPGTRAPGEEAERIEGLIRQAQDIADGSEELLAAVQDWATRYHLSPERGNILRPVRHLLRGRILEAGAECGAITRFLGETGCDVVALEPALDKAAVASARCSGLSNVSVYCDTLLNFSAADSFQGITLIGNLESLSGMPHSSEGVHNVLGRCADLLAPDGVLLLAVENRLALKYFAGAPDEDTGDAFRGITEGDRPIHGRKELEQALGKAGFRHCEFLYPLPDYRLGRLILHPQAFQLDGGAVVTDIIQQYSAYYDPRWKYERLFSERLAWATILRNGLGEEFAPAFFVVAAKEPRPRLLPDTLAYAYTNIRQRCFQKENLLIRERGKLLFRRRKLHDAAGAEGTVSRQELRDERFLRGRLWANELCGRLDQPGWTFQTIRDWFQPYFEFLARNAEGGRLLPPDFLDCTPFNIIRRANGAFEPFDLEWIAPQPVPMDLVLVRGLLYTFNATVSTAAPGEPLDLHIVNLSLRLLETVGLPVCRERLEEIFQWEEQQQKFVVGKHATVSRSYWEHACLIPRLGNIGEEIALRNSEIQALRQQLQEREGELSAIQTQLRDRERQVAHLDQHLSERDGGLEELREELTRREAAMQALSGELEARESQRAALERQLDDRNRRLAFLDERLGWYDRRVEELSREAGRTEQRAAMAEAHVANLAREAGSFSQTIADLTAALRDRDAAVASERNRAEALERGTQERSVEFDGTLAELRTSLLERQAAVDEGRKAARARDGRIAELSETLTVLRAELAAKERELHQGREQLIQLETEITAKEAIIGKLHAAQATSELEFRKRLAHIRTLEAQVNARGIRVEELQIALAAAEREFKTAEAQAQTLTAQLTAGEARVRELQQTLAATNRNFRATAAQLEAQVAAREGEIQALAGKVNQLETALVARESELAGKQRNLESNRSTIRQLHQQLDQASSRIRDLQRVHGAERNNRLIAALEAASRSSRRLLELQDAQATIAGQDRKLEEAIRERVRFEHDLKVTRASWSWRLTGPMRATLDLTNDAAATAKGMARSAAARLRLAWLASQAEYRQALSVIRESGLFDAEYYLQRNGDVKQSGLPPLAHYVAWGAAEGRSPNILFCPQFYRQLYPQGEGANDLLLWLQRGAAEGHSPHPLFDLPFYLRQNPGIPSGTNALAHYLNMGSRQDLDPHPLFDSSFYSEQNPEVSREGTNPLVHYLRRGRHKEGGAPHPLFDESFYCSQNWRAAQKDAIPLLDYVLYGAGETFAPHPLFDGDYYRSQYADVAGSRVNPLIHYLERGGHELRNPHPLFDAAFYRAQLPSALPQDFNPLLHYLREGGRQGLNPHPLFDTRFYLQQCPEGTSSLTPLEHYLRQGARGDRSPHPLFDPPYYLGENPVVIQLGISPLVHYLKYGAGQGRCPNPRFDPAWYLQRYPEARQAGVDPLVHYVRQGAAEGKDPHPSFHTAWYLQANPDVAEAGGHALIHYLRYGSSEGRLTQPGVPGDTTPSASAGMSDIPEQINPDIDIIQPFFDVPFYVRQCPDLGQSGANPFQHYLLYGAKAGKDPHPLFSTRFYLSTNADVARDAGNPLVHFVRYGGMEGRDPHPLFHAAYYLRNYRDVARSGINPLLHYIRNGYAEGRYPNPMFDSGYYLHMNPDVWESKVNPLVHFIQCGAAERRNPHPAFDIRLYLEQYPEIVTSGINPLIHYFRSKPASTITAAPAPVVTVRKNPQPGRYTVEALNPSGAAKPFRRAPTILCVTHVSPYPPRAGNEYAEYRIFDYMERHGYRVVLLLSPLPGEELSEEQFHKLCDRFPYTILCGRDGLIQHRLPEGDAVLNELNGRVLEPVGSEIGEDVETDPEERVLIGHERTFCHDYLARLAQHMEAALSPCVLLAQYIFHTRFLPLVRGSSLKVIETQDMFSTKSQKVRQFGVEDALHVRSDQERRRLLRADLILSCQNAEAQAFAALVPERSVLEVPFDFDLVDQAPPPSEGTLLYVASDNQPNTKGLADFLRLAWPLILREIPGAELLVAGKICRTVHQPVENVRLLGIVDDLTPWYAKAKLTINPAVAGTGMKIKTAESLSYLRPVVNWPAGVDGFPPELAALCPTARDWHEFAAHVITILRSPAADWFSEEQKQEIRELLSPDRIYGPLLDRFDQHCQEWNIPLQRLRTKAGVGRR